MIKSELITNLSCNQGRYSLSEAEATFDEFYLPCVFSCISITLTKQLFHKEKGKKRKNIILKILQTFLIQVGKDKR